MVIKSPSPLASARTNCAHSLVHSSSLVQRSCSTAADGSIEFPQNIDGTQTFIYAACNGKVLCLQCNHILCGGVLHKNACVVPFGGEHGTHGHPLCHAPWHWQSDHWTHGQQLKFVRVEATYLWLKILVGQWRNGDRNELLAS